MKCALGALALMLSISIEPVSAQTQFGAPSYARLPSVWIASGVAAGTSGGNALATDAGALLSAAIELSPRKHLGPVSFALRVESAWSQQSLAFSTNSGMSGDVQTVSGGLALRIAPQLDRNAAVRRVTPYLLAGAGVSRPSTRVSMVFTDADVPIAQFEQTSSEVAMTGVGGIGAQFVVGRARLFAEARRAFARRDVGTMFSSFGAVGLTFQPHR